MQTQTQVPPALQVLMSMGAQPTAPGPMGQPIPTIATQKVEQQAQGLEALMPGVRQQAMQSAQAAQPVTQAQLQQALQQRAPGIAGLPAQNMQFADGGVVGYAGPDGSDVELDVSGRIKKALRDWYERTERGYMERAGATPEMIAQKLGREVPAQAAAELPEASYSNESRIGLASKPVAPVAATGIADPRVVAARTAAPRAEAPVRTAAPTAAPATGIATALPAVTTPEEAMASARAGLGIPGTADLRAAIMEAKQAREQMPATGQAGLAALQEQMAAVKRMEEERKRSMASDRVIAQLLGGRGRPGGLAEADIKFMAGQRAAEDAFYERNVALAAKQDAINDANAARNVGNKEKYAEAMKNLSDAERAIAQAEATYAAAILQNAGTVRGQNVQIQEGALDRAQRERDRQAQAALRNLPTYEQQIAQRVMDDYIRKNPGATLSDAWTFYRGTGKPDRTVMTYDQAADNVSKFLDTTSGMMEVSAIRKRAKDAGQPEPSLSQIRDMLIQRELQSAGGRSGATPAAQTTTAPAVGTVMQGYRFKGGNPADKNNWEKV